MSEGVRRFTDLRAWQACDTYKKAVYRLCLETALARDWDRRGQLEAAVKGPTGHLAEGYGRFNPPDFARYCVMARASLMESQNWLIDAVDKKYIPETTRNELNTLAENALEEVTGLMEYLQSPEALRNARRARERRIATRNNRRNELRTANTEPRTPNSELETPKAERSTEPETPKAERSTEPETPKAERSTEPEHEPRSKKREV